MHKTVTIFLIFICLSPAASGQAKKMEREKRIKKEEIPATIHNVLEKFIADAKKIRYYLETDGDHRSFEIKFLLHKNHYSVEFDKRGMLEDVEMIVGFRDLQKNLQEKISDYLKKYDNSKIKKIQKQFSSESHPQEQVIEMALQNVPAETVRYEIIVETKAGGSWTTYEMLFDQSGNFISQKEDVGRLEDNILY